MHLIYLLIICGASVLSGQECPVDTKNSKLKQSMARLNQLVDKVICQKPPTSTIGTINGSDDGEDGELKEKEKKIEATPKQKESAPPIATLDKDEMCGKVFVPKNTKPMVHCLMTTKHLNNKAIYPTLVDPNLCTHVELQGFVIVNKPTHNFSINTSYAEEFASLVNFLKSKKVNVVLSIGKVDGFGPIDYSKMVESESKRQTFVASVAEVMDKYELNGLLVAWDYPVFPFNDIGARRPKDFNNFPIFLKELSQKLKPKARELYIYGTNILTVEMMYDTTKIGTLVDLWFMEFFHWDGQWSYATAITSPIKRIEELTKKYSAIVPKEKMVLGIPGYNLPVVVNDKKNGKINSALNSRNAVSKRFLTFANICEESAKGGVKVAHNETGKVNSYAFKEGDWVSYESSYTIRKKMELILSHKFAGAFFTDLESDDVDGKACNCGKFHLLRSINEALRGDGSCVVPLCP